MTTRLVLQRSITCLRIAEVARAAQAIEKSILNSLRHRYT